MQYKLPYSSHWHPYFEDYRGEFNVLVCRFKRVLLILMSAE